MWWIVIVVAAVVLVSTYLTWIAARVDRVHQRAAGAYSALDAALVRRASAATDIADKLQRPDLHALARAAIESPDADRQEAENELTKELRDLPDLLDAPIMAEVVATSRRLSLTRQIHTDLVRDAQSLRRRRLVRVMGFGRKHPVPQYFDIEDPILTPVE